MAWNLGTLSSGRCLRYSPVGWFCCAMMTVFWLGSNCSEKNQHPEERERTTCIVLSMARLWSMALLQHFGCPTIPSPPHLHTRSYARISATVISYCTTPRVLLNMLLSFCTRTLSRRCDRIISCQPCRIENMSESSCMRTVHFERTARLGFARALELPKLVHVTTCFPRVASARLPAQCLFLLLE